MVATLPASDVIYTEIKGDGANGRVRLETDANGQITSAYSSK